MYEAMSPITSALLSNSMCPASLIKPSELFQIPSHQSSQQPKPTNNSTNMNPRLIRRYRRIFRELCDRNTNARNYDKTAANRVREEGQSPTSFPFSTVSEASSAGRIRWR